ncbi:hypothetical protein RGQ29_017768 [Quercus rubra]|uniref:Retrotransposon gag protein n=1 Tax=Quercus rubra TaxID=3512 RepID=A0AAN7FHU3_QUERU|nr:hypothetical protein RGQ29_017768 [Quercus rubra]
MQEKQYPFSDSNISKMLDYLLKLKLIELLEMKRLEEADQTNNPTYCKYHHLIGHPIERCFVLNDKIMKLAHQGKITFNDEAVTSNLAMVASTTTSTFLTIQFGSFKPIEVKVSFSTVPILEEGIWATIDELKEVNIGIIEDPRPVFINANLYLEEEDAYVELLEEYKDVFAWSYKEMPGLDPKVAIHHLSVRHGVRPTKQAQRRFRPELIP